MLANAFSIAAAVLASLGGGAVLVLALSSWLGKDLQHAGQERDQRALWKRFGIDTSFLKGEPWPDDFYGDIQTGFESAMRNHERCLEGLKP